MKFVIVTGLSGAGKTTALKMLENMGFFCVDNLPSILLTKFADLCFQGNNEFTKVAVGIDARGRQFFSALEDALDYMDKAQYNVDIIFMSCDTDELVKRYNFTRHVHPLAEEGTILECIEKEIGIMKHIRERASYLIDTTNMNSKGIKTALEKLYGEGDTGTVRTYVSSFGFKRGIPLDADFIFDARFLPNPYNVTELRSHSGREQCVKDYLFAFDDFKKTLDMIVAQLKYIIPQYSNSGKKELSFFVGCTGGYHRSVALADEVTKALNKCGFDVICEHRDIDLEGEKWKSPTQH